MSFSRALLALSLIAPVLVASAGVQSVLYACGPMQQLRAQCCCGPSRDKAPLWATLARSCCAKIVVETALAPGSAQSVCADEPTPRALALAPALPLRTARAARALATPSRVCPARVGEPRAGPSPIILHRRLLI